MRVDWNASLLKVRGAARLTNRRRRPQQLTSVDIIPDALLPRLSALLARMSVERGVDGLYQIASY